MRRKELCSSWPRAQEGKGVLFNWRGHLDCELLYQGETWRWVLKRIFQESTVSSQFLTGNSTIPNSKEPGNDRLRRLGPRLMPPLYRLTLLLPYSGQKSSLCCVWSFIPSHSFLVKWLVSLCFLPTGILDK